MIYFKSSGVYNDDNFRSLSNIAGKLSIFNRSLILAKVSRTTLDDSMLIVLSRDSIGLPLLLHSLSFSIKQDLSLLYCEIQLSIVFISDLETTPSTISHLIEWIISNNDNISPTNCLQCGHPGEIIVISFILAFPWPNHTGESIDSFNRLSATKTSLRRFNFSKLILLLKHSCCLVISIAT